MKNIALKALVRQFVLCAVAILSFQSDGVFAAVTCTSFSNSSAYFTYASGTGSSSPANVVANTVSFNCTRTGSLNPAAVFFGVTNGPNAGAGNNRAAFGSPASYVSYNTFKDAGCSQTLNDGTGINNFRISIPLTAALNVAEPLSVTFYTCINNAQNVTSSPAGVYTDAPNMNLRFNNGGGAGDRVALLNVSINVRGVCSIADLPTTLPLTYTAFQTLAAFNAISFKANCTNLLQYTMALSPTSGVAGGLNYQLGLSTGSAGSAGSVGPTSLNAVGNSTGSQVHFINASMQSGQAGQVSAPLTSPHTLTITY